MAVVRSTDRRDRQCELRPGNAENRRAVQRLRRLRQTVLRFGNDSGRARNVHLNADASPPGANVLLPPCKRHVADGLLPSRVPVHVASSIYPWMTGWVRDKTASAQTNAMMPVLVMMNLRSSRDVIRPEGKASIMFETAVCVPPSRSWIDLSRMLFRTSAVDPV